MIDLTTPEKMTPEEKIKCAESHRDISLSYHQIAERRTSELADEFSRLEVQIATILFAFSGFFFNFFSGDIFDKSFSPILQFGLKITFAGSLFFLVASLAVGLLHIKRKERFWDDTALQRVIRVTKWIEAVEKETTFEEAGAFRDGTSLKKGPIITSPNWSWILQTICLGLAIFLLFVVFLVFLFR